MVDAVPFAVAIFGVVAFWQWIARSTAASALALLLPGWDNSGHFNMFRMVWSNGGTIDTLAPPGPGNAWIYTDYPQGFHATAASIAQLLWPNAVTDVGASLVAYNRVTAAIIIFAVTTIAAGICSVPRLRGRWDVCAPASALVAAAFFLGPGATSVQRGFASFVLPCALIGASIFVAATMSRIAQPVHLLALCGAFVGVAHGWILLLSLALPVAVSATLPFRRSHWAAPRRAWILSGLVLLAAAYAVSPAARIVFSGSGASGLTAPGGVIAPSLGSIAFLAAASLALCALAIARKFRTGTSVRRATSRLSALITILPISAVVAFYLAKIQIAANGTVAYYFWKFLLGAELVIVPLVVLAFAYSLPRNFGRIPGARIFTALGVAAMSLAATQSFGYAGPTSAGLGLQSTDPTSVARAQFNEASEVRRPAAESLLKASGVIIGPARDSAYLQTQGPAAIHPLNAQQWYLSLRGEWTMQSNFQYIEAPSGSSALDVARSVKSWLDKSPGLLVVPPDLYAELQTAPSLTTDFARIRTW